MSSSSTRIAEVAEPAQLERRLEREQKIRLEAEAIAEAATRRLYDTVTELEDSRAELERLLGAQREFIAIAAHELQTPIAPIANFAEMLLEAWTDTSDEDKRHRVEIIDRQARRLRRLATLMLSLSRIESGKITVRHTEIDLENEVTSLVSELAQGRFETVVRCEPGLRLSADPDHVRTILSNLIENGFKHGEPPIRVEAHTAGAWVEIRVLDAGSGVPDEFVHRMFDKFAQARFGSNASSNGTGLGLYIVRNLARAHGGDVWYETGPDQGACFVVRLPATSEEGA